MNMFSLDHLPDKNAHQVGANAFEQHTRGHMRRHGYVVAVLPESHSVAVQLTDVLDNFGQRVTIARVKVGTQRGGDGWGEFNLPWIGQLVSVKFENGITTSGHGASVEQRYYTRGQVPTHPLLNDRGHMKGYFYQAEGGSFSFEHADGQRTEYNIAPANGEGAKSNSRATGVNKSACESRMDKSAASTAKAAQALTDAATSTALISEATKRLTALTNLAARQV